MKTCMLAFSLLAILGFSGIADAAKGQGHGGIRGKIASVSTSTATDGSGSFMITMHAKKNASTSSSTATGTSTPTTVPSTLTILFTSSTTVTINGTAGGKIDSSMVGKRVRIIGTQSGNTVTATSITITDGHHKKPAA